MLQPEAAPGAGIRRPAAVIWDLDGTLVDSAPDLSTALNTVLEEQGQPVYEIAQVRTLIGGGVAKLIERAWRGHGVDLDAAGIAALLPRFMDIYSDCATEQTALRPAAGEVLAHFQQQGVKQGLCTNKPEAVTHQILHALGIHEVFSSIIGGDSTAQRKPHPLPLQTVMAQLGVKPQESLMIGDSGADVGAARAAGVKVILVPDGYTGVPAETLGADYVLESLSSLKKKGGKKRGQVEVTRLKAGSG